MKEMECRTGVPVDPQTQEFSGSADDSGRI